MKLLFALLLIFLLPSLAFSQVPARSRSGAHTHFLVNAQTGTTYTILRTDHGKLLTLNNATEVTITLPQAGVAGFGSGWYIDVQNLGVGLVTVAPDTSEIDGASELDLSQNQGVRIVSDGTDYFTQRGVGVTTELDTFQTVFDRGKETTTATSKVNALRVGDGVNPICIYNDGSDPVVESCNAADTVIRIQANQEFCFYDRETGLDILCIDPDAASINAMYDFPNSAYRLRQSIGFRADQLSTDGAQCTNATERTIGSWGELFAIICTDNNSSTMTLTILSMPDSWDAGTVTLKLVYIQDAANTGAFEFDVSGRCVGDTETPSALGSEINVIDAVTTGSDAKDSVTSTGITLAGTCAAGDMVQIQIAVDAPGTAAAMATLNIIGGAVEFSVDSLSD